MRGRPPLPLKLADISGAARKNPQRYRARRSAGKLAAASLGEPPQEWIDGAVSNERCASLVQIWREVVAQDVLGVLNIAHRALVESFCHLQYKIRRASKGYGKATSGDYAQLKGYLAAMGMTPIDSSRVAEAVRLPGQGTNPATKPAGGWGELVG